VEGRQLRWKNNPKLFFFGRMIAFDLFELAARQKSSSRRKVNWPGSIDTVLPTAKNKRMNASGQFAKWIRELNGSWRSSRLF
jgi:hypothetical protein